MADTFVKGDRLEVTFQQDTDPYYFIKEDGSKAGAGGLAVGVNNEKHLSGEKGTVLTTRTAIVNCGGTFAAGGEVMSDANGKAVAATTGNYVLGIARGAGADGGTCEIILKTYLI